MAKVGIVGLGNMGRMFYGNLKKLENVEIVAVCEANPNIIEDSKKAVGNIEGATAEIDFDEFALYSDLDTMLAEAELDAIFITLPTFLHADFTVKGLEAGVDVFCEKPMSLDDAGCARMQEAQERTGKTLQVGHCIRFWPEYAKTKEIIDGGEYGDVKVARFRRVSFPPAWSAGSWFMDETRSGGMALDLHIHDTDYIQYVFGMPKAVRSVGVDGPWGGLGHISTFYEYDSGINVFAEGSWIMANSFGFEMSFSIILEKATITFDCTREPAFRVCPQEGDAFTPEVAEGDGYSEEIKHFVNVVNGVDVPEIITPAQSRASIAIVKAENESAASGDRVVLG